MVHDFVCNDCKKNIRHEVPAGGGGTGYAIINGHKVCYECCAVRDIKWMKEHGRISLYLSGLEVTNWPGTLRLKVWSQNQREVRAGFCGRIDRTDFWFTGPDGFVWHGVSMGDMELAHCRRTKTKATGNHAATK